MDEHPDRKPDRKQRIKDLIRRLHAGADPASLKDEFGAVLGEIDALELSRIEEELIREGMPRQEVQRLCHVHLAVFRGALEQHQPGAGPGHPINTLMEEHRMLLDFAEQLVSLSPGISGAAGQLKGVVDHIRASASHYTREENVLFPYLERHGITEPPAIMWSEHDQIRAKEKELHAVLESSRGEPSPQLVAIAVSLHDLLSSHFYKENNILFPAALKVISEGEWRQIRQECDGIGYCCFTPPSATAPERLPPREERVAGEGYINLESGGLSVGQLVAILNTLPVDLTFVDDQDRVAYFSEGGGRIFPRSRAIIGRRVQQCHPEKSVHAVQQILDDFRSRTKDKAEFWINLKERLIYIRYFAVRDSDQRYLGCLEFTQDITDVRQLEGEKRLL